MSSPEPLVLVERDEPIALVTLNRPKQLNALSEPLMEELVARLVELDRDAAVRCIVLAGSERAFAAGADIGEMAEASAIDMLYARRVERWDAIRRLWTPLVAAVSGWPTLALSDATTMSQDSASSQPRPRQNPETAATSGVHRLRIASQRSTRRA